MTRFLVPVLATVLAILAMAAACSSPTEPPPPEEPDPLFEQGDYGGPALPGTEELFNLMPSPDGEQIALIRARTPSVSTDPRNQLWIVDRDGSNPRLISVNTGTADWSPDGNDLAVTVGLGGDVYAYTIDLETLEATQWTGREDQRLSLSVANDPEWFSDGHRLLVTVSQKAYQQSFERGQYIIDTRDSTTTGPIVELMQGKNFGNGQEYIIGKKYLRDQSPPSGNFVRYDIADSTWHWITDIPRDSLTRGLVDSPVPSPRADLVVQPRYVGYAKQLFLFRPDRDGTDDDARPITELGGENPRWEPDGTGFIFQRDVHRGSGARYVPFRYDLETQQARPLWPALPDSVPDFPDLSTQTLSESFNRR
jgi:hypothetical protein